MRLPVDPSGRQDDDEEELLELGRSEAIGE